MSVYGLHCRVLAAAALHDFCAAGWVPTDLQVGQALQIIVAQSLGGLLMRKSSGKRSQTAPASVRNSRKTANARWSAQGPGAVAGVVLQMHASVCRCSRCIRHPWEYSVSQICQYSCRCTLRETNAQSLAACGHSPRQSGRWQRRQQLQPGQTQPSVPCTPRPWP
jgi:hypothetical protein